MIKEELIGAYMKNGSFSGIIKNDPKSIKLYKMLGLDIFEDENPVKKEPIKKDATKKKSTKQ